MSVKAMARVWDSDLAPNHKLVLLAYADAAEHDGTQAYPGWERLVEMTGYSRSQVDRITKELIEAGVLERVRAGRRGQRAEFAVLVTQDATQTQEDSDASGPVSDAQLRATSRPNSRPTSPNGDTGLFDAFYEFWTGNVYIRGATTVPKSMRGRINAAVKEAREAEITAGEVWARGEQYRKTWSGMERTPQALLANWHRFTPYTEVPECVACENRGLVALDADGEPTDWDNPFSSMNAPCPQCSADVAGGPV